MNMVVTFGCSFFRIRFSSSIERFAKYLSITGYVQERSFVILYNSNVLSIILPRRHGIFPAVLWGCLMNLYSMPFSWVSFCIR